VVIQDWEASSFLFVLILKFFLEEVIPQMIVIPKVFGIAIPMERDNS
jgi:hypothetical protein